MDRVKKWQRFIFVTLLTALIGSFQLALADTLESTSLPSKGENTLANLVPAPPKVEAKAYILLDANSGKVIAEQDSEEHMAPASLTKMMTMYIISSALKNGSIQLDDEVRISKDAWSRGGSKMFVKEGQKVQVNDLIQGIIVDSGNDACVAMAEYIAGDEEAFATIMNQTAKNLGMNDTHFTDSTGLPNADHYSTPKDMAILARALFQDFPEYYHWYSQKWFTFNDIKQPNRNRLLWRYEYADGIKTGHTDDAGYCLAASAEKDGMRLITVVMGTPSDNSRAQDSQRLLTYGFRFFKTYKLYEANQAINQPRVWKGKHDTVNAGITEDLFITIPAGRYNDLQAKAVINTPLEAPIAKGETIGELKVSLNDQPITSLPIVALKDNPKGGAWSRMTDSVSFSFHKWFGGSKEGS